MHNILKSYELLLASKSPRRRELMDGTRIPYQLIECDWDEIYDPNMKLKKVPQFLSYQKAQFAGKELKEHQIILAADTVVIKGKKLLGKPKDKNEALKVLKMLSGSKHIVITGITLMSKLKTINASCTSKVKIDKMTETEIEEYIDTFQPFDKAGSYGIQDWIGICKVSEIRGSYHNIMGLPTHLVYKILSIW